MDIFSKLVPLSFTCLLMILGWLFGRSWHKNISKDNAIQLPQWLRLFFGPPSLDGYYNIRGIYFQIFILLFTLPFLLVDLGILTRHNAFQGFVVGMLIFPILEILRWILKR